LTSGFEYGGGFGGGGSGFGGGFGGGFGMDGAGGFVANEPKSTEKKVRN
jgi:hypothetical protein